MQRDGKPSHKLSAGNGRKGFCFYCVLRSRAVGLMSSCKNDIFAYFKAHYMHHIFTTNIQKLFDQENV